MHAFMILSDPVRRRILEHLCVQELSSGDVVSSVGEEFGISQSAISQHLKVLRENRFANVRVDGARRIYSLEPSGLLDIDQWLIPFRRFWEPKLEALAKEVERGKKKAITRIETIMTPEVPGLESGLDSGLSIGLLISPPRLLDVYARLEFPSGAYEDSRNGPSRG